MSETPEEGAPAPAAKAMAEPRPKTQLDTILSAVKELLPAVALSVSLPLMICVTMPASNEKVVLSLVSGLFGVLVGRATAPKGDAQ